MDNQVSTHQIKISSSSSSTISGNNEDKKNKKMYKGVRLRKWGKWVSEIRLPNSRERIWLGSYDSAEKAARAFDAALYCLRGPNATFNFPDTPFHLDINVLSNNNSLNPQEIREVAANFANKNLPIIIDNNNTNININNNGNGNVDQSNIVKEISGSSSSTMYDNGNMIDWTFLNMLDGSSDVGTENYGGHGFYSDLEKMHSGELLYSIPPTLFEDYNHQNEIVDDDNDDTFSSQSFLWSWNF